jgi:cytochrome b6-f complex iron-sulfur subunit
MSCNRRDFLQTSFIGIGTITLSGIAGSFLQSCSSSNPTEPNNTNQQPASVTIDLSKTEYQALQTAGGTVALGANAVDGQGILLIRDSNTVIKAYSRNCTHQGCMIGAFNGGISSCPCHGSQFNTSGNVTKGPASSPLKQYTTKLESDILTISG